MQLRKDRVYMVESAQDASVRLALGTHVLHGELRWFDTVRGRCKRGRAVVDTATELVWQSTDGARYRFVELTLDRYNRDVRPRVELSPAFATQEALHGFYLQQFGPMIGLPTGSP